MGFSLRIATRQVRQVAGFIVIGVGATLEDLGVSIAGRDPAIPLAAQPNSELDRSRHHTRIVLEGEDGQLSRMVHSGLDRAPGPILDSGRGK